MKNFQKFLEEISIEGNPALPGEGGRKDGETKWSSDVENRAKQRMGLRPSDITTGAPSATERQLGHRLMQLLGFDPRYNGPTSKSFTDGNEDSLSNLAVLVFKNLYQELIDRYEIELDIKIIKPGRVKQWMDEQEESEPEPPPEFREVTEEDIKNEVYKRKISNLIIQGEAKNTKHILHSESVKEGLEEIYGDEWETAFNVWDEISKIADKLDWIIPIETKQQMMEQMPEGIAGACFVGWKKKENEDEEENEEEESNDEYFGDENEDDMDMEDDSPMERFDETPIIRARGVDFPMLLHESVKALFELLSIGGIPEDERVANIALSNTGYSDEPEDFRYGPEIASDLRDFINANSKIDTYPNIREEVYKVMVDKETMPVKDFLDLMRGILSKTERARVKVDRIIDTVISNIKLQKDEIDKYNRDMDQYNRDMEEYEDNLKNTNNSDDNDNSEIDDIIKRSNTTSQKNDYSTMSQSELQRLIDDALDNDDYDTVKNISKYLKEGKEIYLRELNIINERRNLHTDRKNKK